MERPTIVCLCGSTRFWREFQEASLRETLAGKIVLSIGAVRVADDDVKQRLDELHKRKIDLADEVLILNVDSYIGLSTLSELAYARVNGKRIRFLEKPVAPLPGETWEQAGAEPSAGGIGDEVPKEAHCDRGRAVHW